jgi:CheY-like chemotaxis protein
VIDDNAELRAMLKEMLEAVGHVVAQADNGLTATSMLCREPPDVVLTDLVMPEQDGIGLIMFIRKELPNMPVVAMSGHFAHAPLYLQVARKLGARRVLIKPFSFEALIDALNDALGPRP